MFGKSSHLRIALSVCVGLLVFCICQKFVLAQNENSQTNQLKQKDTGENQDAVSNKDTLETLQKVIELMEQSSDAISAGELSGNPLQVRNRIVSELQSLLPDDTSSNRSNQNNTSESNSGQQSTVGESATDNSNAQPVENDENSVEQTNDQQRFFQQLVGNTWGHLPQRLRQRLINSTNPSFLSGYEEQIEEYYRRLSEMSDNKSP